MPTFIKMDISELPALIASFSLGPMHGAAVCLIATPLWKKFRREYSDN